MSPAPGARRPTWAGCAERIRFARTWRAPSVGNKAWRAYLSAEKDPDNGNKPTDARSRIGTGPCSNAKGVVVAKDLGELYARKGDADVFLDERGQRVPGQWPDSPRPNAHDILTGSTADGKVMAGRTCNDLDIGSF